MNEYEIAPDTDKTSTRFILDSLKKDSPIQKSDSNAEELLLTQIEEIKDDLSNEPVYEISEIPERKDLNLDKKYYRISEVSELLKVEPHVIRYWQSEFYNEIKPIKTGSGHWVYPIKAVKTFSYIKYLLYDEKFSISGAKKKLKEQKTAIKSTVNKTFLKALNYNFKELIKLIKNDPGVC